MADMTFEEIVQAAQKLTPEQKAALARTLQRHDDPAQGELTRDMLIATLEARRASGAFKNVETTRNKYARPELDLTQEALDEYLHQVGSAWEEELDDLDPA